jgi:hypothetical protein
MTVFVARPPRRLAGEELKAEARIVLMTLETAAGNR